jgi:hypothetical protein
MIFIFSENQFPPRIKFGAGFFGIICWKAAVPIGGAVAAPQGGCVREAFWNIVYQS